ncbi:MAG: 50S ribosomal protein L6 [Euryarchaeota archaeon]|nr:50S ribosomal protein L6 [Euryarchaeota archaeon]MDE1835723.1 50S ribosomal protein L6 [Euryarchaeota archaeon]MDE1880852.1 50S ribosomal protein L6 [Euryarchaeota archaeon]MDE2043914.1 50S ribosomal protein L6 [Thermoplasmata archaeon]
MSTETQGPARPSVEVALPQGAKLRLDGASIVAEGKLGKVARSFPVGALALSTKGGQAVLTLLLPPRKRSRALLLTWERHVANLLTGVTLGFEARCKAVSAHFPMKLSSREDTVLIENFLNEKMPRRSKLLGATKAAIEGDVVVLKGNDIEAVGQSAANLERATRIRNYDPRVFQDGVYIIVKAHPMGGE